MDIQNCSITFYRYRKTCSEADIVSLQSIVQLADAVLVILYLSMTTGHLNDVNHYYALRILATNPLRPTEFYCCHRNLLENNMTFDLDLNVTIKPS